MGNESEKRPVLWVASSKRDLMEMPADVQKEFGHGLHEAQLRNHPKIAKTLSGFGGASVLELIQDHESGTYRAVYTVRFVDAVVVLHAFQKKSKKGIQTDKKDIELVKSRLKIAEEIYREWGKNKKK